MRLSFLQRRILISHNLLVWISFYLLGCVVFGCYLSNYPNDEIRVSTLVTFLTLHMWDFALFGVNAVVTIEPVQHNIQDPAVKNTACN